MNKHKQMLNDLREIIGIQNEGAHTYRSAAGITGDEFLKNTFLDYARQRETYVRDLKIHLMAHTGGEEQLSRLEAEGSAREQSGLAVENIGDALILDNIENREREAIEQYDKYIADYPAHADHINLLREQRDDMVTAIKGIENLRQQVNSKIE